MDASKGRELLADRTDWVLVRRDSGMIIRGLPRWEVAYQVCATVTAVAQYIDRHLALETPEWIVVGEWRRK